MRFSAASAILAPTLASRFFTSTSTPYSTKLWLRSWATASGSTGSQGGQVVDEIGFHFLGLGNHITLALARGDAIVVRVTSAPQRSLWLTKP